MSTTRPLQLELIPHTLHQIWCQDTEKIRNMIGGEINIVLFPADYESTGERTHEGWINLHGKTVLVFPDSVDKLVQRGYLIKPA